MGGGVALNAQDSNIDNTKIAKIFDLGQVEVTEKRIDENRTTNTIDEMEIKDMNMKDVAQSLSYTSGITYSPASGSRGENSFQIRGFSQTQVGIFHRWNPDVSYI